MWFWWFMFFCNLIVPVTQMFAGRMMWKHCPSRINRVYGYRTRFSMKNMDTWKFANEHCGRIWWKVGALTFITSVFIQLPFRNSTEDTIGTVGMVICIVQVVVLISSIIPTEIALRKTFDEKGMER